MVASLRQLWKSIDSVKIAKGSAEATQAVFKLAKALNKPESQNNTQIKCLVEKIPTLLDALNSPLAKVIEPTVPFLPIATGIIKFIIDANHKEPTIPETVAIISQVAYLESISKTLPSELICSNDKGNSSNVEKQLEKARNLQLNYEEATLALVHFPESKLAQEFNEVLSTRLKEVGIDNSKVATEVEKVAINTQDYISLALAEAGEDLKAGRKIINWYISGGRADLEKKLSINKYLEDTIKLLPEKPVFEEEFKYKNIYVPLKAISVEKNGEKIEDADDFILDRWVQKFLDNPNNSKKVLFIQAGSGRGKSFFCRMFADQVRLNLHPKLTPIFIRIRDIEYCEKGFDQTLSDTLSNLYFVKSDNAWLANHNTRYLFLLDGLDELPMKDRASRGIGDFIDQVVAFLKKFSQPENGHRVILTGRPIALQGISCLPDDLEIVKLLPMDNQIQQKWLTNWEQVVFPDDLAAAKEETKKFKEFLEADECPKEIKDELAREPLLLYLLAKLHRDKAINKEDFKQASNSTQVRILIYEKSLDWVLKKQRETWLKHQIKELNTRHLERILTEVGLCVVQSGGEYATVEMIETRLKKDDLVADIIKKLQEESEKKALTTALGAFYIRPAGEKEGGGVEFNHKSFGEFLCAKRLLASLEEWTESGGKGRKWNVDDEQLTKQIYDLLGYGDLTLEIVKYLRFLLVKSVKFRPVELFQRLKDFYWVWCDGEFIDTTWQNSVTNNQRIRVLEILDEAQITISPFLRDKIAESCKTTPPLTKMRELKEQLPKRETYLGQRQIDVYAGLNIMILLLELHRYGQSQKENIKQKLTFYPCGQPIANDKPEDSTLLLRLIGYSNCIGTSGFKTTVGRFLSGANLKGAILSDKERGDVRWNKQTNWSGVQRSETAINVPEALRKQLLS